MQFATFSVSEKFSPNTMELQKLVASSMALLATERPIREVLLVETDPSRMEVDEDKSDITDKRLLSVDEVLEKLKEAICQRAWDLAYRSHLLKSMSSICNHDKEKSS